MWNCSEDQKQFHKVPTQTGHRRKCSTNDNYYNLYWCHITTCDHYWYREVIITFHPCEPDDSFFSVSASPLLAEGFFQIDISQMFENYVTSTFINFTFFLSVT